MRSRNSFFYFIIATQLFFYGCSRNNSAGDDQQQQPPRTFVRIEVDNQVYEYFDDNVKSEYFFGSYVIGALYDTSAADLQGKPGFFISYSGQLGQPTGDFWVTWGTWIKFSVTESPTPTGWTTSTLNTDPAKRRFTVSKISSDKKSWSGDFYHEVRNSLGETKIIKGTYAIIGQ